MAKVMEGALRPLGIGEVLDASIKIYLARWKPMVIAVGLVTAPAMVLSALVQVSAGSPTALTRTDPDTNLVEFDGRGFALFIAALAVTTVITLLATNLATAGVLRMVTGVYLGEEVGWRESLRFAFSRFGSLTWLLVLTLLGSAVGLLACVVGLLWLQGVWAVAFPVLLVEGVKGKSALGRSYRLVRGRFWPVFGTILLGTLLAGTVQGVLTAPVLVLTLVEANFLLTSVLGGVVNIIGTAITAPFVASLTMVIYFDLRVRKEGFDLFLLARRVGVESPSGGFPAQPGARPPAPAWPPPTWSPTPPPSWGGGPGGPPS